MDISTNNVECALALDFSGDVTIPAGSRPEDRLHVTSKSPVAATYSNQRVGISPPGDVRIELKQSGGVFNVSDLTLQIIPLFVV
jgi:hypothetical protein